MFEQNILLGPGTGTFASHTFEIIIMLGVAFLLGVWLGYVLWGRYKQTAERMRLELESAQATRVSLVTDLDAAKNKLATAETELALLSTDRDNLNREIAAYRQRLIESEATLAQLSARVRQLETELALTAHPEETVALEVEHTVQAGETVETTEDAQTVETEETMVTAEVAETTETGETVNTMEETQTTETGETAEATEEAQMVELPVAEPLPPVVETPVRGRVIDKIPEKPGFIPLAALEQDRDDLKIIEGIGPKIEELLMQYGIRTLRQLADTDVDRLRQILQAAGPQLAMHDPGTWPAQANLAANGEWETLKSVQSFLKAGRKPN